MSGATASTFLLTHDELDHTITVRVSFTDDDGYSETVASNATAPLAALLLLPGQVRSQLRADVTLVSNAGQASRSSDLGFTNIWTLGFVTGSNGEGYNLSNIALIINSSFGGTDPNIYHLVGDQRRRAKQPAIRPYQSAKHHLTDGRTGIRGPRQYGPGQRIPDISFISPGLLQQISLAASIRRMPPATTRAPPPDGASTTLRITGAKAWAVGSA